MCGRDHIKRDDAHTPRIYNVARRYSFADIAIILILQSVIIIEP